MPQIDQLGTNWYAASQIFWLVLVFGAVYFIIGRGMLSKVEATVDARDRKIADDIVAAKASRDEADVIEAQWREGTNAARAAAQGIVAAAKADAGKAHDARLAEAGASIEQRLAAAEAAIGAAHTSAMAEIESVATDVASGLIERLTGKAASMDNVAGAVKAHLHV